MDPSREIITHEAALLAAVDGLDRLSVGRLAAALGMSKSEVSAHFGSKQDLQLAIVREAAGVFTEEVVRPALAAPPGLAQLTAVCEAFFAHLERPDVPRRLLHGEPRPWSSAPGPDRSGT